MTESDIDGSNEIGNNERDIDIFDETLKSTIEVEEEHVFNFEEIPDFILHT